MSDACLRGDLCLAAFERGEAVGYCWLVFAPLPHLDGVWVDFDSRAAWVHKSLLLATHCGRGIAPALYPLAERCYTTKGREYALICMESHNRASISAAQGFSSREAGGGALLSSSGRPMTRHDLQFLARVLSAQILVALLGSAAAYAGHHMADLPDLLALSESWPQRAFPLHTPCSGRLRGPPHDILSGAR